MTSTDLNSQTINRLGQKKVQEEVSTEVVSWSIKALYILTSVGVHLHFIIQNCSHSQPWLPVSFGEPEAGGRKQDTVIRAFIS